MTEINSAKLDSIFKECRSHVQRLESAGNKLKLYFPLDVNSFLDMEDETVVLIDSAEEWQFLRNLRNNLAHDYPESVKQTVETLNILYKKWDALKIMYISTKNYLYNLDLV